MTEDLGSNDSNPIEDCDRTLTELLRKCLRFDSSDSLTWSEYEGDEEDEEEKNRAAEEIFAANSPAYHSTSRCFWGDLCCDMYSNLGHQCVLNGNICIGSYVSDDSVVSDNVLEEHGRISLAYENLKSIPKRLADKYASHTRFLDLSYNNFRNISFLVYFHDLHTLILDRNYQIDVKSVPFLPNLKILWINNCDIKNMVLWIRCIRKQFPSLEQLSVMGNPGLKYTLQFDLIDLDENLMPTEPIYKFRNKTHPVTDYREFILDMLPNLQYLDGSPRDKTLTDIKNLKNVLSFSSQSSSGANNCRSPSNCNSHSNSNSISNSNNSNNTNKLSSISFKDIFRLKRHKNSAAYKYQQDTSSTN